MSTKFKPWLVLAVIFLAGVLTGTALTIALAPHFDRMPASRDLRQHWMTRLTDRLKLTADQQTKIQPILTDASTKIQALHRDEIQRGSQIFKAANEQIATLLTPDQQVEMQKMEAEREKMFSGHVHHHNGNGDDGGTPAAGPTTNAPPDKP